MSKPADLTSVRIVVADDNQDTATGLAILLREAGFQVVATAFSGADALRALAAHRPTVAILDIVMPQPDGCEIAEVVRTWQPPRPQLIAVSGLTRIWDRADAAEAGFAAHFTKPVPLNALYTLLASYAAVNDGDASN